MIFISHNSKDKQVIEPIAIILSKTYGTDKVFYDSWSIQPGDGIIDKMNEGLTNCKFFFYFISKNSLNSEMVKLEWQNALVKSIKGDCKFIPVRLDDSSLPQILVDKLYVDLYSYGLDVATRQMVDVVNGENTFKQQKQFSNLVCEIIGTNTDMKLIIKARAYMEPISRFIILINNDENELSFSVEGENMITSGFNPNISFSNGVASHCQYIALDRATTPSYPTTILIKAKTSTPIRVTGIMHKKGPKDFSYIPVVNLPI